MIAKVTFTEVDGQLGAVNTERLPMAIAGLALRGVTTPRLFANPAELIAEYGGGDLVEASCVQLKDWGGQVLACRIVPAASGSATLVTTGWTGTSTPTVHTGAVPLETASYRIKCGTGGIRGTSGITYFVSYDGGQNYGGETALGVATDITLSAAIAGTLVIDFGAGTWVAGEVIVINTVAAVPTALEVSTALDALGVSDYDWDCFQPSCPVDATIAAAIDTSLATQYARAQCRYWIGSYRLPTTTETAAQYLTAVTAAWGSYSNTRAHIFPDACWFVSRLDGRKVKRVRSWAVAPYVDRLPRHIDPAQTDNGTLPGVQLSDANGNPDLRDERLSPAYDALGLGSLYSRKRDGVYIGNCRTKSPTGSDYRYVQTRRVIDIGERALNEYLQKVLNREVTVSKKTGLMLPSFIRRIKIAAERYIESVYSNGPMVSGLEVNPDATANILSTESVPFDFEVVPLGYVKSIPVRVLLRNPVITTVG